jgi:acyl-CoA synthetase (AMP-forming)/AMP-acid ligase II
MQTVRDLIERNARYFPTREAFVCGERRLTHAAYAERARRLASGLYLLGLRRQDRLAILAMNCLEFFEVYAAAEVASYIAAPINYRLAPAEMVYLLRDSGAKILIFEAQYLPVVEKLRAELPDIQHYICIDGPTPSALAGGSPGPAPGFPAPTHGSSRPTRGSPGPIHGSSAPTSSSSGSTHGSSAPPRGSSSLPPWALAFEQVIGQGSSDGPPIQPQPEDYIYLWYTSGTTGKPKGVAWRQWKACESARANALITELTGDSRVLQVTPVFHIGGKGYANGAQWMGGCTVLHRAFDPVEMLATFDRERITMTFMVAAMLQAVLAVPDLASYDVSSIRTGAQARHRVARPGILDSVRLYGSGWHLGAAPLGSESEWHRGRHPPPRLRRTHPARS